MTNAVLAENSSGQSSRQCPGKRCLTRARQARHENNHARMIKGVCNSTMKLELLNLSLRGGRFYRRFDREYGLALPPL